MISHNINKSQLDDLETRFSVPKQTAHGALVWVRPPWLELLFKTEPGIKSFGNILAEKHYG